MTEKTTAARAGNRILLLGIGLETGNLGLGALACGTLESIYKAEPNTTVYLLDYGKTPRSYQFRIGGKEITVELINLRFSWRLYLPNNIFTLLAGAFLSRLLPSFLRAKVLRRNHWLCAVGDADLALAISGGDSFSDIYGIRRLLYVSLPQFLVLAFPKPLILLPQTYGPFQSLRSKIIARAILKRACRIFARDRTSLEIVQSMSANSADIAEFSFDMGFALVPSPPPASMLTPISEFDASRPIVGLNMSGLLYMGGYTKDNMFGLKIDYPHLMTEVVRYFVQDEQCQLLLIPHVFGNSGENDVSACQRFWDALPIDIQPHVAVLKGSWDQSQIKYAIGKCQFFLGSRMHACIAALSQSVPAIGLAYSMKFEGVFRSVGVPNLVLDLTGSSQPEILAQISRLYSQRLAIANGLAERMPEVRAGILDLVRKAAPSNDR